MGLRCYWTHDVVTVPAWFVFTARLDERDVTLRVLGYRYRCTRCRDELGADVKYDRIEATSKWAP